MVVKQKGESQNGGNNKTKHAKFSEKWIFLPPDTHTMYMCVSGGKECSFFGKFGVLCFVTYISKFIFLPYYQRFFAGFNLFLKCFCYIWESCKTLKAMRLIMKPERTCMELLPKKIAFLSFYVARRTFALNLKLIRYFFLIKVN